MRIVAKTDIGKIRKSNQDSYAAGEFPSGVAWAVVCDGMGGVNGGNIASSMAVKIISEEITSMYTKDMSDAAFKTILFNSIKKANRQIYDYSIKNKDFAGMGTTVVVCIVKEDKMLIAHVGDSRAYLIDEDIKQITKDHSVVQELIETGEITPKQAKTFPGKNIITRAVGVSSEVDIDFSVYSFDENKILLMCTDGLSNYVEPSDIKKVTENSDYYEYADKLINVANKNGGGDNITVIIIAL
ncbi:MAG: Stp1/IreP family PP2C-type Ser/Thr phosphatase [Clostridia bacterium]|nr:Stp1/IreP family PP2C-type Ser/Thr phosphatase [Clostridia bacterium]